MHRDVAKKAIDILKNFDEVSKIILYGSVYKNEFVNTSDIDLAFICDDVWRSFPLDLEGNPSGLRKKIDESLVFLNEQTNIKFQIPIYWSSDLEQGIELYSGRKLPPDILPRDGKIVYDNYK